ncbi:MAG: hypothetical protein ABI867_17935 [Kofleriaceae bacterium]
MVLCGWTFDSPDATLGDHLCKLDKTVVKGAAAYALYVALAEVGIPIVESTESGVTLASTRNVWCVVDPSKGAESGTRCDWDGSPAKPVAITPKKALLKDYIQPVKIEKQKK